MNDSLHIVWSIQSTSYDICRLMTKTTLTLPHCQVPSGTPATRRNEVLRTCEAKINNLHLTVPPWVPIELAFAIEIQRENRKDSIAHSQPSRQTWASALQTIRLETMHQIRGRHNQGHVYRHTQRRARTKGAIREIVSGGLFTSVD